MFFEKIFAFSLIILLSPILTILCLIIFFYDYYNPLYSGKRVGKSFVLFNQLKLRSMSKKKINNLAHVTSSSDNDPRITPVGRLVRRMKLDELPQLFNILVGHMSFVGPRPNVLNEVEKYYEEEKKLLTVKPGITDFASIVFADEGNILSQSEDPDLDYNLYIRFWKSSLGLIYIKHRTFMLDIYLIFLTIFNFFNRDKTLSLISCKIAEYSHNYKEVSEICLRKNKLKKINFDNKNFINYKSCN
jgi:lipopolysaccharide/colanic/teichoic acid biosynthesis glycosyltransferase